MNWTQARAIKWIRNKYSDIQDLHIECVLWSGKIKYPTGLVGAYGRFFIRAPGYKARIMTFESDAETGTMLR